MQHIAQLAEAGVYTVKVIVSDKDGGSGMAEATSFIVVYDPDGGFVTGGGWIDSPEGACPVFCDDATGKANFGFVSKYKNGATVPTGQTGFNFSAGDLNFHSTSYDWLVIAGKKAMYKGDGTVNGEAGFTFQLNALDGDLTGGDGIDRFRIKIKETGGGVIYDNQMGAGDNDDPVTSIGGGQIKIHKQSNLKVSADTDVEKVGLTLTRTMLDSAVTEAINYWSEQKVTADQLTSLGNVDISIADLVGSIVATASSTSTAVRIDRDTGGYGWSLAPGSNGVDLLSAVTHEFGHILGLDHDVLGDSLHVGQRRLPMLPIPGDSNLDRVFDRLDVIGVLQSGKYLTDEPALWADGDWNGDGQFDQMDIVAALQAADRFHPTLVDGTFSLIGR